MSTAAEKTYTYVVRPHSGNIQEEFKSLGMLVEQSQVLGNIYPEGLGQAETLDFQVYKGNPTPEDIDTARKQGTYVVEKSIFDDFKRATYAAEYGDDTQPEYQAPASSEKIFGGKMLNRLDKEMDEFADFDLGQKPIMH